MAKVAGSLSRESDGRSAFPTTVLVLASDESRSNNTYSLIQDANGDWRIPVTAGKIYRIKILGLWQTSNNSAGAAWKVVYGGGAAGTLAGIILSDSATTGAPDQVTLTGDGSGGGYNGAISTNTSFPFTMEAVFRCTTGGTFNIHMAANVASVGTAKTMAGSALIWDEL